MAGFHLCKLGLVRSCLPLSVSLLSATLLWATVLAPGLIVVSASPAVSETTSTAQHLLSAYERRIIGLRDSGRTGAAEHLARKAVEVARKNFPSPHWQLSRAINNLGSVYAADKRFRRAADAFKKALAINVRVFGPVHLGTAVTMNNLARAYLGLDYRSEALRLLHEVLRVQKLVVGRRHPLVAITLNNLGTVQKKLRNYDLAKRYYRASIEIDRAVKGAKHVSQATTLRRLAALHIELGEVSKAVKVLNEAISALDPDVADQQALIELSKREIVKLKRDRKLRI